MHGLEGNASHSGLSQTKGTSLSEYLKACASSQSCYQSDSSIIIRSQRHKQSEASVFIPSNKENFSPIPQQAGPFKAQTNSKMFDSQGDHEPSEQQPKQADSPPRSKLFTSSADLQLFGNPESRFEQQEPQLRVKTAVQAIRASIQKLRTSQAELVTATGRVFFKIIVYSDKVETWQIDAEGNIIPGGLLEVQYGEPRHAMYPSERILVSEYQTQAGQGHVLDSKVLSIPLTRQSQEKFSLLLANQQKELESIEQKIIDVRNSMHLESNQATHELLHHEQHFEQELERLEQNHLQEQQELLRKEYEAFSRAKKSNAQQAQPAQRVPGPVRPLTAPKQTVAAIKPNGLAAMPPQQVVHFQQGRNPFTGQQMLMPGPKPYSESVGPNMFESCLHEIRELQLQGQAPAEPMSRDESRGESLEHTGQKPAIPQMPETGISRDFGDWLLINIIGLREMSRRSARSIPVNTAPLNTQKTPNFRI